MKPNTLQIFEVGDKDFKAEVLGGRAPVLVAFLAPWSRPCQTIRPALDEVATACADRLRLVIVNVDDHPDLGVWYDIQSVPTVVFFVGAAERTRIIGTASKQAILGKLEPLLGPPTRPGRGMRKKV